MFFHVYFNLTSPMPSTWGVRILSFFVDHQFWIFTVFFVGADQDEVHVGGDAETAVAAEFTFQLGSQIGGAVV